MQREQRAEEFLRRAVEYDDDAFDEFLKSLNGDVRETINYLIVHRQLLKEEAIDALKREADELQTKLQDITLRQSVEEIKHFRDVLRLHKRLVQEHGDAD